MIGPFLFFCCVALICIGVARLYVWVLDWRGARRLAAFRAEQLVVESRSLCPVEPSEPDSWISDPYCRQGVELPGMCERADFMSGATDAMEPRP